MCMSLFHRSVAVVAFLLGFGCAAGTPGGDKKDGGAHCNDNNDCRPGYVCVGNQCVLLTDGGGQPAIKVEPLFLVFDEAVIGSPQTLTTIVTNVGSGTLELTDVRIVENDTVQEFSFAPLSRTSLAAQEGVAIRVTLDPVDALLDTGSVIIESNDPVSPSVSVSLSSAYIGDPDLKVCVLTGATPPDECVDPMVVNYGVVPYGTTAQADFYLANQGTGNRAIVISSVGVTSPTPSHVSLFDVELFQMVESTPGVFVETPVTLPVDLSPSVGGDPDPFALYGRLHFTANTDGFLILDQPTLVGNTHYSDDPTPRETMIPILASIEGCPPGLHDINNDPTDGCEYSCNVTNGGVEACDGVDNDCDGVIDDFSRACYTSGDGGCNSDGTGCQGICQAGSQTCTSGNWSPCEGMVVARTEQCNDLDDNCNGVVSDVVDEGGNACGPGVSIPKPDRPENGSFDDIVGNITPGDVDWYVINFLDQGGYPNTFNIVLEFTAPPGGGSFRMDVYEGNCTTAPTCLLGGNTGITRFTWNAFGQTTAACTGGPQPCGSRTKTLYIKVYSIGSLACETYTLRAKNG